MTQRLFPDFGSEGLREARMVFMVEISGEARRLDQVKRGPGFAEAKKALRDAATTLNNKKVNEMLANEETLDMIASQVELLAGNDSKKWLNAIALSFLQKSHEVFTGEGQAINAAKDKSTDLAKQCAEILKATIDDLRKLQKAYSDAGGVGDFPGFDAELQGILTKKTNVDAFKKRFDQLVDLMKDILWATDDDLKDGKKWTNKFKTIGIPETSLTPFTTATDATARRSALLKIVRETGGIELLSADERKKVEAAMKAIDNKLSELQMNQQKQIAESFQERLRYLDRLGGTDQEALIHLSLEPNGKFRLDALIQRLEILKKTKLTADQKRKLEEALGLKTSVELTEAAQVERIRKKYQIKDANEMKRLILLILKGGRDAVEADRAKSEKELKKTVASQTVSIEDFSRDLLSLWNTGKAEEYLKSQGVKIDNPTGISLSALALRARMPETVVQMLEDGNYRPSPSVLVTIAKMEKFGPQEIEFGKANAKVQLDILFADARSTATSTWASIDGLTKLLRDFYARKDAASAPDVAAASFAKLEADGFIRKSTTHAGFYVVDNKDKLYEALGNLKCRIEGLGVESATAIVESVTEPTGAGGNFRLKNDGTLLLEYLTFIHFTGKGDEAAKTAKDKLAEYKAAGGPLKQQADNSYLVDKPALIRKLSVLAVTDKPMTIYTQMRTAKVHEVTWKESVSFHASEFWKLTKVGGGIWWDYIASLRKNIIDPDNDPKLTSLLDQQAALRGGKASLEKLLKTSTGAQRFLETTEAGLRSRREAQLKALRGVPAVSPSEHQVQAEALLLANQYVIGQLNTMGWSTCSRRLRQLTLWVAMHKSTPKDSEAGLKEARQLLQEAGKLRTPEEQDTFVDEQMAKMNVADKQAFLRSTDARAIVETQAGRDILSPFKQRGLNLKPGALDLLRQAKDPANAALNLAAGVGRWTMDPPEKVADALAIALEESLAKDAYIEAFVTGEDQTYEYQGRTEKVSVIDARLAVNALQQRLLFEMRGSIKAKEQIEDEYEFTNPVDRWLRTGIESMKDLWNTDMVGKAEVIAIVFAAYWMIKEAWKSKKGKFALLGLPILLGANAIVKQRTGRDLLGENLRWKNKEDRTSPLEAFRRRGAALDKRYKILLQPSGQAAMRVLMNEKNPVQVQELLAWRNAVKAGSAGGKQKFSLGAPRSLRVSDIEDNMGATGSREKAYEVAYLAFEALCGDVARINGLAGGNTDTNAEQGADLIQRRYVLNRNASLKPATMFEVIMSECQMPTKEMLENRSYLEAAADLFGYSYDEAKALVKKYGVQAWVMMKQGVHKVPEIAGAAVDYAGAGWDGFKNWAALTWAKGKPEMMESISALWRFLSTTTVKGGMTLVSVTPDAAKWVIDKSIFLANGGKDIALATYRTLLRNGVTGPILDSLIKELKSVTGWDIDASWKTPEHKEKLSDLDTFIEDLSKQVSSVAELPPNPEVYFKDLLKGIKGFVIDGGPEKTQDRLLTYELARRQVFSFLAAERVRAIRALKGKPPADLRLTLPIRPAWPDADSFHEKSKADEAYLYFHDNYSLQVVLAALGNQQTFVGLMKLFVEKRPDLLRSQVFDWLLWPDIHEYVTRDEAGAFLITQWQSYVGSLLNDAEKDLPPDAFKRYKAYVQTLMTNVMVEMILDVDPAKRPEDLKLLKGQAKEFYRQLLMRRGTLDPHQVASKANPDLFKQFVVDNPHLDEPADLLTVAQDKDLRWVLLGETPPESAPASAPAAPGAPPAAPARMPTTDVDRLRSQLDTKIGSPAGRKELLAALNRPGIGALDGEIRAKFDALPVPTNPDMDAKPEDVEQFVTGLLGKTAPNAEAIGKKYLDDLIENRAMTEDQRMQFADWFANEIASKRSEYPGHPRFQRFLDQGAAALLSQTAEELSKIPQATLLSDPRIRATYEHTLLALYQMTAEGKDHVLSDDASRLLEYVLFGGAKGKYQEYVNYLTAHGLVPPTLLTGGGRRVRSPGTWFSPYTTDAEMRLLLGASMNASTIASIANNFIQPHHATAKSAPW